jgi:hypothetical protein
MRLSAGDWVEVRIKEEILATLDAEGRLEGMPFMPEMLRYCGRSFRVAARAHKTCDTVNKTGMRKLRRAVHLDTLRCDGSAHGGCQADCLLFWHEAWLKPRGEEVPRRSSLTFCTEDRLKAATQRGGSGAETVYSCQATRLPEFTEPLTWSDLGHYLEDWTSGNFRASTLARSAIYVLYVGLIDHAGRVSYTLQRWLIRLYNRVQNLRGGAAYPRLRGEIPRGVPTPVRELGLQPGESVRVLPFDELLKTLNGRNRNKGMYFDAECVPFCGNKYKVRALVNQIIDERTGKMIRLQGKNVSLDGVWCRGLYGDRRMHCPRAIVPIWKETWLERCEDEAQTRGPESSLK